MQQYRAEARAIRGLSYLHAIDMFGNVPFTDENSAVGGDTPQQISRADLFTWLVNDMEETAEILTPADLARTAEYYRKKGNIGVAFNEMKSEKSLIKIEVIITGLSSKPPCRICLAPP